MQDSDTSVEAGTRTDRRGVVGWLVAFVTRLTEKRMKVTPEDSPRRRPVALALAFVLFVGASAVAITRLPPVETEVRLWVLALVPLLGVPLTVSTNAAEFRVTAALSGHDIRTGPAVRVAVMSTAANLLPIPGAFLVRAKALRDEGSTVGSAVRSTGSMGMAWIGVTFVLAGSVNAALADAVLGLTIALAGIVVTTLALVVIGTQPAVRAKPPLLVLVVLVEAAGVTVNGLRFLCVLVGLGYDVGVDQAIALTVAGVLASATGFFPGGLGIREILAGAISPTVGLPAAVGVVASSTDRLAGILVLAVLSAALVVRDGRASRAAARQEQP